MQFLRTPTPGPQLMRVHLVQNSTIVRSLKKVTINIHLVRPIIHLVQILALSD